MQTLDAVIRFMSTRGYEAVCQLVYSVTWLILLPTAIAIVLALACSLLIVKNNMRWIMQVFNFFNAIPAMIMFIIMVRLGLGLGLKPSLISLTIYATIPIMVATVPAMRTVGNQKGISLGMNWYQTILYIDIPMSSPSIVSGIKLSMIYGISNSILCASIGAEGLGRYVLVGLAQMRADYQIIGAVPLVFLALIIEYFGTKLSDKLAEKIKQEI